MQKIIIDTNVIVSSLLQKSYPFLLLRNTIDNPSIEICISDDLFEEYFEVLQRDKFKRFPDFYENAKSLLFDIKNFAKHYKTEKKITLISDDPDNRLLELALASQADFIITGNHLDFKMKTFESTVIINPKDYWENHLSK